MPIYKCTTKLPDESHPQKEVSTVRVVEAANAKAARNHVAKDYVHVEVIDTPEAMGLASGGAKLEKA